MNEQGFRFGRSQHLVGICSLPAQATGTLGVIVFNAGLVHRIGPFRLHVELCRQLAMAGYPALRFDLSGIGDSRVSGEPSSDDALASADAADAMRLLTEVSGCTRFVLIGLCSGADNAHVVARDNPAVAGAVFLDGYAYRTPGHVLRHYLPRLFSVSRWRRFLSTRLRAARVRANRSAPVVFGREFPPRAQVREDLEAMLARGLKLNFIYSGGISRYFNHRRQFRECFGRMARHANVTVDLLAGTDHTYILGADRARLIGVIEGWMRDCFPVVSTGGHA